MEYLILFLPLIGAVISGFFGNKVGDRNSQILTSSFVSISAILSLFVFYKVISSDYSNNFVIATWINSGTLNVNWSIKIDSLSAVMFVVVNFVSSLVHIYSIGYMSHDPHKTRFMFTASKINSILIKITITFFLFKKIPTIPIVNIIAANVK